jgi:hypothetical protein
MLDRCADDRYISSVSFVAVGKFRNCGLRAAGIVLARNGRWRQFPRAMPALAQRNL